MSEANTKSDIISIRGGLETDLKFVYATWLKGLYFGNDWFREIDQDIYFKAYHKVIERILAKPKALVWVAHLIEDPDVILGYSVTEGPILHFVFVKEAWRRMGLACDLIPDTTNTVTHLTKVGRSIKPKAWSFNPFAA